MDIDTYERKKYAKQWAQSSLLFLNNKDYVWMCNQIEQYSTVLEIGCGTGHSTLSLIQRGHKVIAIEKNEYCLEKAKILIVTSGYTYGTLKDNTDSCNVIFVLTDICDQDLPMKLSDLSFSAVVCWNIGTYWSKTMFQFYLSKLLEYGLTLEQIKENLESSYAEFIQWYSCKIAREFNVPIHFIDRNKTPISEKTDPYYVSLKEEFNYLTIEYDSIKTVSKSSSGRTLTNGEEVISAEVIEIFLVSVFLTN